MTSAPVFLLCVLLAPQGGKASAQDEAERLVRELRAATNEFHRRQLADRLGILGDAALAVLRREVGAHLESRKALPPPAALLERLDATAALQLEEYGHDVLEAVETAAERSEGARRETLQLLAGRIAKMPRIAPASWVPGSVAHLVQALGSRGKKEDEELFLKLLEDLDPQVRHAALETLLYRIKPPGHRVLEAALAASDRFPETTGRLFWEHVGRARISGVLDSRSLWSEGGPWSRSYAVHRLRSPDLLERASVDRSRYVREAAARLVLESGLEAESSLRLLGRLAEDPVERVRDAVLQAVRAKPGAHGDVLLRMAMRESRDLARHQALSLVRMNRAPVSEAVMLDALRSPRADVVEAVLDAVDPERHPGAQPVLAELLTRVPARARRAAAYSLARFGAEDGLEVLRADLASTDFRTVQGALQEIGAWRIVALRKEVAGLAERDERGLPSEAKVVFALLAGPGEFAMIRRWLDEEPFRSSLASRVAERARAGDAALLELLAGRPESVAQGAAMSALERLDLREPTAALLLLEQSKLPAIANRAAAILGRLVYPSRLHETLEDLASPDPVKSAAARRRYDATRREGVAYRIVDGPAAIRDRVVDVPVPTVRALVRIAPAIFKEIAERVVAEPLPAKFLDLRGQLADVSGPVLELVLRRGRQEERRALLEAGRGAAEMPILLPHLEKLRAADARHVDSYVRAWLKAPPPNARPQTLDALLDFACTHESADARRELCLKLFLDAGFQGSVVGAVARHGLMDVVAEAVRLHREGAIRDRPRLLSLVGAAPCAEAAEFLKAMVAEGAGGNRVTAAEALCKVLHAEALPFLGQALQEFVARRRWQAVLALAPGLGAAHRETLKQRAAETSVETRPFFEVLLYLAGSEEHRRHFLAYYPDPNGPRAQVLRALEARNPPPDDDLVTELARQETNFAAPGPLLRVLDRCDTDRAAALAAELLDRYVRLHAVSTGDVHFGVALVARRLGDRAIDLLAALAARWEPAGSVKALAALEAPAAVEALLRVAETQQRRESLAGARAALLGARRHPELVRKAAGILAAERGERLRPENALAVSAYVEGEESAAETLEGILRRRGPESGELDLKLVALHALLTVPGGEERARKAAKEVAPSPWPVREILEETLGGLRGEKPGPADDRWRAFGATAVKLRAFLLSRHRDAKGLSELLAGMSPPVYLSVRPFYERASNLPLTTFDEARAWAARAATWHPVRAVLEGFRELEYDVGYPPASEPLLRALTDSRADVRGNVVWLARVESGLGVPPWKGPWLEIAAPPAAEGIRFVPPGEPLLEELAEAEQLIRKGLGKK